MKVWGRNEPTFITPDHPFNDPHRNITISIVEFLPPYKVKILIEGV